MTGAVVLTGLAGDTAIPGATVLGATILGATVLGATILGAAILGEAVARLPADACAELMRGVGPRSPATQLLIAGARCAAVLGTGIATVAVTVALADPAWSWTGALGAVTLGVLPLAAAPLTVAPLFGAPLRIGLLVWCAARVVHRLGAAPATFVALLAGLAAAAAVWQILGPRSLVEAIHQSVRDCVSVLVASPIVVAVGVVPLLVALPLAPWELWRYCLRVRSVPGPAPNPERSSELFVVYLDGVGKTWPAPTRVARDFIAALGAALPDARFVTDVLPYSPLQSPLTNRVGSGWFWRPLRRRAFPMLVGHNILQTVVATDVRYQQAYGHALAHAISAALRRAGYRSGDRVALVGYSGGAVIGVAAADPLAELIGRAAVVIISIGGYLDGRRLPDHATVHHVVSDADRIERLGKAMFPARWGFPRTAWTRALSRGEVVVHSVPGSRHIGPRGYLSAAHDLSGQDTSGQDTSGQDTSGQDSLGTSNLGRTVAVTVRLLQPAQWR